VEGDGGGDRALWPATFPELKEGVKKLKPALRPGVTLAEIGDNQYRVFETVKAADEWALGMSSVIARTAGTIHFGLDTEWNIDTRHITRVISIYIPTEAEGMQVVAVLDLTKMGCVSPSSFPQKLKQLLENPRLVPVAVNISADAPRLEALGVHLRELWM